MALLWDFIRILMGFSTSLSPITHIKIYEKPIIIQKSLIFSLYLYYYYGVIVGPAVDVRKTLW